MRINDCCVRINNISKHYGKRLILKDISIKADPGMCIGILGENGCGKSTFLSILARTVRSEGGSFLFGEEDLLANHRLHSRTVGYVPQGIPLLEELSAMDNLHLWYPSRREIKNELESGLLAILGIQDFLHVPVSHMSGGMKKRLSIGCAVAGHPKILLLDEPSSALDLICKERIGNYLKEFKSMGGIVFLTTHDVQELPLCDELYILKQGNAVRYDYDGNYHRLAGNL